MEHYVTLFDSFFLPQGLALHASMQRVCAPFTLWVLCMDDKAHEILLELQLPGVRLLQLSSLETEELLKVKSGRTRAEYCWTLTPFTPRFVFEAAPEVSRVTYVDADLWFRRNPRDIFSELEVSGKSVLITDHGYAPEYDQSVPYGRFCVQFMTFIRTGSETVRRWWEARCIEWCHSRIEDGKFGDQKYLDDWPERFEADIHVLQNEGFALAPWNATRFPHGNAVFFHFHSLRLLRRRRVLLAGRYTIPECVLQYIYAPYLRDLSTAVELLETQGWRALVQDGRTPWLRGALNLLSWLGYRWTSLLKQAKIARL